jgi:hypothetical protein
MLGPLRCAVSVVNEGVVKAANTMSRIGAIVHAFAPRRLLQIAVVDSLFDLLVLGFTRCSMSTNTKRDVASL